MAGLRLPHGQLSVTKYLGEPKWNTNGMSLMLCNLLKIFYICSIEFIFTIFSLNKQESSSIVLPLPVCFSANSFSGGRNQWLVSLKRWGLCFAACHFFALQFFCLAFFLQKRKISAKRGFFPELHRNTISWIFSSTISVVLWQFINRKYVYFPVHIFQALEITKRWMCAFPVYLQLVNWCQWQC